MRRNTTIETEEERLKFVKRAAEHFANHSKHWSFGDLRPGDLMALRWGMGDDCVLLLKLDDDFQPTVYGQAIEKKDQAA